VTRIKNVKTFVLQLCLSVNQVAQTVFFERQIYSVQFLIWNYSSASTDGHIDLPWLRRLRQAIDADW